ncbi:MAG: MscS Mechanosensitive ion channel [candidate division TM6 bacterium GW2011_GWE2_36_25]|nr:MAG: MscS Mechanosensitive ion channel [candidate division TM6 bacterium GW2011_GWF2_36_131]KKQ03665.1 MAG: MscS Mechanosensitive ion channel [candidate division TM6 bacterium GW2011_GWE2_36_25]KKQ18340.1 MAG: MscS Mechanosensitive ion channel [candidate division TM6 bacterium GW2011_GWA2_36_9]
MKRIIFLLISLFFTVTNGGFFGLDLLSKRTPKTQFIVTEYEEKKQKLERLKKELADLESIEKSIVNEINVQLEALVKDEKLIKSKKSQASVLRVDFLNKQETFIRDIKQFLNEFQQIRRQEVYHLKKNVEALERYIDNPVFSDLRIADKASYQFSEFQNLSKQLLSAQEEFIRYRDEKKRIEDEISNNTRQFEQIEQELKQKEKEQEKFSPAVSKENAEDLRQKSELIDWEIKLLKAKKSFIEEKGLSLQRESDLINLQLFITKIKLDIFKKDLSKVDRKLWVNESDIQSVQAAVEKKKQQNAQRQERYVQELAELASARDKLQKEFDVLNEKLPTPVKDLRQLNEWLVEAKATGDEIGFYHVAYLNDRLQTIDRSIALIEAKQALNKTQIFGDELQLEAMKAWLIVTQRKLMHDDTDRQGKLDFFVSKKIDIDRELDEYKSKENAITNLMSLETRAIAHIKQGIETLKDKKSDFAKKYGESNYQLVMDQLAKSQNEVNEQLNLNGQLIKIYSSITSSLSDIKRQSEMIIRKLEGVGGIWQRSAGAITWEGIKSTIPDIKFFWEDLINIVSHSSATEISLWFKQIFGDPINILNIIFALLLFAALYFLLAMSVPLLGKLLRRAQRKHGWQFLLNSFAALFSFLNRHLVGIFLWSVFFCVMRFGVVIDFGVRVKVLFYLLSIPYLCYLSHIFMRDYLIDNGKFMSDAFRERFSWIFQLFMFATIIILFFREAFIITTYGHSELPTILLAIYSIITRASLVFLIMTKELILDALPNRGKIWLFIKEQINQYYLIFLVIIIALIIMSDPFVGYSKLVTSMLQGTLWTIILIALFWWVQKILKRYSSDLFFVSIGETVKERFSYAKTWYALFIVVSFAVLIAFVVFLFAKIWGYPVSADNIANFFNVEITKIKGDLPGETIPITLWSIVRLIAFIFGGFLIATIFNRYVLERIYNLLQVDAGVQNTISRITSYVIVLIIVIIGLTNIGLGSWVPVALGALVVGIAFAIKGPADDFVSYFIILVERFVKIGDYIRLNDVTSEISGVVRKITPRSVILRKKNAYNIIIPNSKITKSLVLNWNYARSYFAFEDMYITIAYSADPMKVKDTLLKILDENPSVLKSPMPIIRIINFTLSGYEFLIRGYLSSSNVLNQWDIRSDIRFAIAQEFKKAKIKIAVPVRDVTLEDKTSSK